MMHDLRLAVRALRAAPLVHTGIFNVAPDVRLPLQLDPSSTDHIPSLVAAARLKPGASIAAAQAQAPLAGGFPPGEHRGSIRPKSRGVPDRDCQIFRVRCTNGQWTDRDRRE